MAALDPPEPDRRITLEEVARLVGGTVMGDASVSVAGVAPLNESGPRDLGLLADKRYLKDLPDTAAAALLVSESLLEAVGDAKPTVVVRDAHAALVPLLSHFHPEPGPKPGVHSTAVVGRGVLLGQGVEVGPYAVLGDGCEVADGARLGAHVVLGPGCRIGEGSVLHPHVVLYPGTTLGRRVIVHSGARLGSDGFGYAFVEGGYRKIPQVGGCVVEDDVEVGANTCVDRGSIGDTVIGRGSKLDNLVHLAHNVRVGPGCAMAAQVGIAGSTRLGAGVALGGQAGVAGHIEIGDGAQVAAQAGVIGDLGPREVVAGYPARNLKDFMKGAALMLRLPALTKRVGKLEQALGMEDGEPSTPPRDAVGSPQDGA